VLVLSACNMCQDRGGEKG